jgi:peptide/nickel transport system ATP-binding protein
MTKEALLSVRGLNVEYSTTEGVVNAVSDVSFDVMKDEVFGLAGESGCGKSTLIRALLRLLSSNGRATAAAINYDGEDIGSMPEKAFRESVLWKRISLVPQSAMNSLNPVYRVGDQVIEAIRAHEAATRAEARERVAALFDVVGLQAELMNSYPHEFSGGMRQRAMIAMSLALDPGLIIMDEPTTGLDVLVQERILRRIREIRAELSSSIILITHDIAVIAEMSDRIAVMYGGKIMESANVLDLFESPYHPYTLGLKNAFPSIRAIDSQLISIPGTPPSLIGEVSGCLFEPRCPFRIAPCARDTPVTENVGEFHQVRCLRHADVETFREKSTRKSTWHS